MGVYAFDYPRNLQTPYTVELFGSSLYTVFGALCLTSLEPDIYCRTKYGGYVEYTDLKNCIEKSPRSPLYQKDAEGEQH
jgi:hypothetical protein